MLAKKFSITSDRAKKSDTATKTLKKDLTREQYIAACDIAGQINQEKISRTLGIAQLALGYQMNKSTASALINNYRCLRIGITFKAPMSADAMEYFTDSILAMHGAPVLSNVLFSLGEYITYSSKKWKTQKLHGMQPIMDRLQSDMSGYQQNNIIENAIRHAEADTKNFSAEQASEILREIWVRGPQHAALRRALKRRWNNQCAVHEDFCNGQLRASHIVAWRLDEALRGDVDNGLLLSVPLDNLFDCGLIAFCTDGEMLFSGKLLNETMTHFGLRPGLKLAWMHLSEATRARLKVNLARHRNLYAEEHGYA